MSTDLAGYGEGLRSVSPQVPIETDENPRCHNCDKLLAIQVSRPWLIACPRCKAKNKKVPTASLPSESKKRFNRFS